MKPNSNPPKEKVKIQYDQISITNLLNPEFKRFLGDSEKCEEILGQLSPKVYASIDEDYFYDDPKEDSRFIAALGPVELIAGEPYLHDKVSMSKWIMEHCSAIAKDMGMEIHKGSKILNTYSLSRKDKTPITFEEKRNFMENAKIALMLELNVEPAQDFFVKH